MMIKIIRMRQNSLFLVSSTVNLTTMSLECGKPNYNEFRVYFHCNITINVTAIGLESLFS